MTIRTQKLQVLKCVVLCITVNVVHLESQRLTVVFDTRTSVAFVAELLDKQIACPASCLKTDQLTDVLAINEILL